MCREVQKIQSNLHKKHGRPNCGQFSRDSMKAQTYYMKEQQKTKVALGILIPTETRVFIGKFFKTKKYETKPGRHY